MVMDKFMQNEQLRNGLIQKKMEFDAAEASGDKEKAEKLRNEIATQFTLLNLSTTGTRDPIAMTNKQSKEQEVDQFVTNVLSNMGLENKQSNGKAKTQEEELDQFVNNVLSNTGLSNRK